MNFLANLREAYVLLKRAEELGQFFQHSPEQMQVVDIARRATAKAIQLSSEKKTSPVVASEAESELENSL